GALKAKQSGFFNLSWLRNTDAYRPTGWSGSADDPGEPSRLLGFYRSHGFVHASVGTPVVTSADEKSPGEWKRRMRIEIPVVEGEQYRVGTLAFQGLVHVTDEEARGLFELRAGGIYDESKVDKARDGLKRIYGRRGFMQASSTLRKNERPGSRVLDL